MLGELNYYIFYLDISNSLDIKCIALVSFEIVYVEVMSIREINPLYFSTIDSFYWNFMGLLPFHSHPSLPKSKISSS